MSNLQLSNYTQGIRGGKGKSVECGYSLLTSSKSGHTVIQVSIDTFEGAGKDYKERENPQIEIYFPGFESWKGTPEQLKSILNPSPL